MTTLPCHADKKILVLEDHPLFRAMLVQLIKEEVGLSVCCEADNINDALQRIETGQLDLAIIDLTLQGSGGLVLLKMLKTRNLQVPVLVLSMHEEKVYAERVLRAGARGYISKLASPAEVVVAIRTVAAGGIYVSQSINGMLLERLSGPVSAKPAVGVELLSNREVEVYQLIGCGLNTREISERLNLGSSTVDSYRARIKEKLGIKNSAELYMRAAQWVTEGGL